MYSLFLFLRADSTLDRHYLYFKSDKTNKNISKESFCLLVPYSGPGLHPLLHATKYHPHACNQNL